MILLKKRLVALLLLTTITTYSIDFKETPMTIKQCVIPAAGRGTRFLPYTKAVPKELVPLNAKPAIHYVVDEAVATGINQFTIITSTEKPALKNYFDANPALDAELAKSGKSAYLSELNALIGATHFNYAYQAQPLGLAHAIAQARDFITDDYFAVMLPDDVIDGTVPSLKQLADIAQKERATVILVQEVPAEKVHLYGVVTIAKQLSDTLFEISDIVEKPALADAPSNITIIGRYIIPRTIFDIIDQTKPDIRGEISFTDSIKLLIARGERVLVHKVQGTRFDLGSAAGWLEASLHYALKDPKLAPIVKGLVKDISTCNSPL